MRSWTRAPESSLPAKGPSVSRRTRSGASALRVAAAVAFAWLSAAGAQPAHAQYRQLLDQSVQLAGQGRYAAAVETAEAALRSAEESLGPEHLDVALALNNLAEFRQMAAFVSRDPAAIAKAAALAEPLHRRALSIREKTLGLRHSFTLASMINLARVHSMERKYDDAEAEYRRAQAIIQEMSPSAPVLVDLDRQATAGLRRIAQVRGEAR